MFSENCIVGNKCLTREMRVILLVVTLVCGTFSAASLQAQSLATLDENCIASILNRNTQVSPDGSFGIGNIPSPPGPVRVRIVCEGSDGVQRAQTEFFEPTPNGTREIGNIFVASTAEKINGFFLPKSRHIG